MTDHEPDYEPGEEAIRDAFLRVHLRAAAGLLASALTLAAAWAVATALTVVAWFHYLPAWVSWPAAAVVAVSGAGRTVRGIRLARSRPRASADAAETNRRVTEGSRWRSRQTADRVGFGVLAVCGGWALWAWPGVAVAVVCTAYRMWFRTSGIRRQWRRRIYPLLRMSTAQGFDQTPEI